MHGMCCLNAENEEDRCEAHGSRTRFTYAGHRRAVTKFCRSKKLRPRQDVSRSRPRLPLQQAPLHCSTSTSIDKHFCCHMVVDIGDVCYTHGVDIGQLLVRGSKAQILPCGLESCLLIGSPSCEAFSERRSWTKTVRVR